MAPAAKPDTRRELEALLKSRLPLIIIETRDESRALALLSDLAPKLAGAHTPVFQWTVTDGLRRLDIDLGGAQRHNAEPAEVLKSIRATATAGVYVLLDFHPFMGDPLHVRLLKDICLGYDRVARTIVLISHELALPRELEHLSARFQLAFPERAERQMIIEKVASDWSRANAGNASRPIESRSNCWSKTSPACRRAIRSGSPEKRSSTMAHCSRATCQRS